MNRLKVIKMKKDIQDTELYRRFKKALNINNDMLSTPNPFIVECIKIAETYSGGWIDVTIKLPEKQGYYICWCKNEKGLIHYHPDTGWQNGYMNDEVSHWVDLIPPFKNTVSSCDHSLAYKVANDSRYYCPSEGRYLLDSEVKICEKCGKSAADGYRTVTGNVCLNCSGL